MALLAHELGTRPAAATLIVRMHCKGESVDARLALYRESQGDAICKLTLRPLTNIAFAHTRQFALGFVWTIR